LYEGLETHPDLACARTNVPPERNGLSHGKQEDVLMRVAWRGAADSKDELIRMLLNVPVADKFSHVRLSLTTAPSTSTQA